MKNEKRVVLKMRDNREKRGAEEGHGIAGHKEIVDVLKDN